MKTLARKQLGARNAQAVRFAWAVLGDDEPDNIEDDFLEDDAEHQHIRLANRKGATHMAAPTRQELLDRIAELETENEDLRSRIDEIGDIIGDNDQEDIKTDEGEDDDRGED